MAVAYANNEKRPGPWRRVAGREVNGQVGIVRTGVERQEVKGMRTEAHIDTTLGNRKLCFKMGA